MKYRSSVYSVCLRSLSISIVFFLFGVEHAKYTWFYVANESIWYLVFMDKYGIHICTSSLMILLLLLFTRLLDSSLLQPHTANGPHPPRSSILTIFWELSLVPYWKPILVQSWLLDVSTCIVYLSFYCNKISYKSNLREKGFTLAHSFRWDIMEEKTWQPEQEAASYIVSGSRESWMLVLSSLSLFYAVQDLRPGCLLLGFVFSPQLT